MIKLYKLFFAGFAVTILGVGFAASKDRADTSGDSDTRTAFMPDYGCSASGIQSEGGGGFIPRGPIVKVPGDGDRALDTKAGFDSNK